MFEWQLVVFGLCQFLLGSWFGVWRYKRKQSPYKFLCLECKNQGETFTVGSNDPGVTAKIADDHMLREHR